VAKRAEGKGSAISELLSSTSYIFALGETPEDGQDSFDNALLGLAPELSVSYFNFASAFFSSFEFEKCHKILERLVDVLVVEPRDQGLMIRACFLLIETIFRRWKDFSNSQCNERGGLKGACSALEGLVLHLLNTAERAAASLGGASMILIGSKREGVFTESGAKTTHQSLLQSLVNYKVQLYRSRLQIYMGNLDAALATVTEALAAFDRTFTPLLSAQLAAGSSISSTLSGYIGTITCGPSRNEVNIAKKLQQQRPIGHYLQVTIFCCFS
jgi:hypothetical protein